MLRGTDWRLKAKLNTEIDPVFKKEAREIIAMRAILLEASPKVLGSEINAAFFISLQLIDKVSPVELRLRENLGANPRVLDENACIPKCMKAPNTTPIPNP